MTKRFNNEDDISYFPGMFENQVPWNIIKKIKNKVTWISIQYKSISNLNQIKIKLKTNIIQSNQMKSN